MLVVSCIHELLNLNYIFLLVVDILITGTTHGIGTETARVLALRGVHVIMAARDVSTFTLIVYFWLLLDNVTTGASSGIGAETTRVLAMRGVHVIMGVRNVVAAKVVMEAILKEIPTAKVDAMELDLSSMTSVRKFALEYISSGLPLNILM